MAQILNMEELESIIWAVDVKSVEMLGRCIKGIIEKSPLSSFGRALFLHNRGAWFESKSGHTAVAQW